MQAMVKESLSEDLFGFDQKVTSTVTVSTPIALGLLTGPPKLSYASVRRWLV